MLKWIIPEHCANILRKGGEGSVVSLWDIGSIKGPHVMSGHLVTLFSFIHGLRPDGVSQVLQNRIIQKCFSFLFPILKSFCLVPAPLIGISANKVAGHCLLY